METNVRIISTASYIPSKKVTNKELTQFFSTSDEWIVSRTGIKERHVVVNETTTDLCCQVGKRLVESSGISPKDIDFIIVATMTPDNATPSVACVVQEKIEADNAFAYDISAACSGFLFALSLSEKILSNSDNKIGLVIGGDTISKILNWKDRSTAVLFGDGAGGVVLRKEKWNSFIIGEKLCTDGKKNSALLARIGENQSPFYEGTIDGENGLKMDGKKIFAFVLKDVYKNIIEVLKKSLVDINDIDYFLFHQSNGRLIEKLSEKLKIDKSKCLINLEKYGNTAAASLPILLDEAVKNKKIGIGSGKLILLVGYGGGLSYGSMIIKI